LARNPNPKISAKYAGVVEGGTWTGKISRPDYTVFDHLPKKPKRVFVGSMTDLFHKHAHIYDLDRIFLSMSRHPLHTFLILTKRPERMKIYMTLSCDDRRIGVPHPWPLPNVWLGVTVCNQEEVDKKIPFLLQAPAAKRFISVEPMLEPVDLHPYLPGGCDCEACTYGTGCSPKLDWVICGGETGPGARPAHPDWVRGLRDQCQESGTPYFFKGWGEWGFAPGETATHALTSTGELFVCSPGDDLHGAWPCKKVGKRRSGRLLDGQEWNEVPA
jgi:protein gp37